MKFKKYLLLTAALLTIPSYGFANNLDIDEDLDVDFSFMEEDNAERQKREEEIKREMERLRTEDADRKAAAKQELVKAAKARKAMIEENAKKEAQMQAELEAFKNKAASAGADKEQLKKEFTTLMAKLKRTGNASGHIINNYKGLGGFWDQRTDELLGAYNKATEDYVGKVDALLQADNHNTQRDFLNQKKREKKKQKSKK